MDEQQKMAFIVMTKGLEALCKKMMQEPKDYDFIEAIANFYYMYTIAENTNTLDSFYEKLEKFGLDILNGGNVKTQSGGNTIH